MSTSIKINQKKKIKYQLQIVWEIHLQKACAKARSQNQKERQIHCAVDQAKKGGEHVKYQSWHMIKESCLVKSTDPKSEGKALSRSLSMFLKLTGILNTFRDLHSHFKDRPSFHLNRQLKLFPC